MSNQLVTAARNGARGGLAALVLGLSACAGLEEQATDIKPSGPSETTLTPIAPSGRWSVKVSGQASTPPMGWNSWNAFRTEISEEKVIGAAEAIVQNGLDDLGYRYINIDDGWWRKRRASDGRMIVNTQIFPSAQIEGAGPEDTDFRPFVDRLHGMGLKAGIYTDIGRNACSQAYDLHSPNLPVGTTAEREVGLFGHVEQDIELYFGAWGFDYVKVDACGINVYGEEADHVSSQSYRPMVPLIQQGNVRLSDVGVVKDLYGEVRDALVKFNPDGDFVYSICNWGSANVRAWGKDQGNLWRTSGDIVPVWPRLLHSIDSVATRSLYAGPGTWNDPDMLYIGHGEFDENHLTEARSHFAIWSILAAPLLIGYDLRSAPQSLMDIWSAEEIVAVNQDAAGNQGTLAYDSDEAQIFVKALSGRDQKAVALFNRTASPLKVQLTADHLKMKRGTEIALRDLWAREPAGTFVNEIEFGLAPHETLIFKATGPSILDDGLFLSELPGRINVAEDGVLQPTEDPTIFRMIDPWGQGTRTAGSRPGYAGWGGPRVDATPYGQDIRIAGKEYRTGIGILGNSRLEVRANREFSEFSAIVGIDDSSLEQDTRVVFEVFGDGKLLSRSSPVSFGDGAIVVNADVRDADIVELIARQEHGADQLVIVAWADAALTR